MTDICENRSNMWKYIFKTWNFCRLEVHHPVLGSNIWIPIYRHKKEINNMSKFSRSVLLLYLFTLNSTWHSCRKTGLKLIKYTLKNVLVKAMFTLTVFEILLFEVRSILWPAQRITLSKRVTKRLLSVCHYLHDIVDRSSVKYSCGSFFKLLLILQ